MDSLRLRQMVSFVVIVGLSPLWLPITVLATAWRLGFGVLALLEDWLTQ